MQLPWAAVISVVGMASLSQAAECYAQSHGSYCVNKDQLQGFAAGWCQRYYKDFTCDWYLFEDSHSNTARIGKVGTFTSVNECRDAWGNIVNQCFGNRNGGSWTWNGVTLNINFCAW